MVSVPAAETGARIPLKATPLPAHISGKPRNTPLSSTEPANSSNPMLAIERLLSIEGTAALRLGTKQVTPRTSNRSLQLGQRCYENVDVARFNLLNRPGIETGHFSQLFLAEPGPHPPRRTLLPKSRSCRFCAAVLDTPH